MMQEEEGKVEAGIALEEGDSGREEGIQLKNDEKETFSLKKSDIKLAIVGSRNFTNKQFFEEKLNVWKEKYGVPDLIISGGATGADALAENYAREHRIPFKVFAAEWKKFGKSAGPIRNSLIVKECTHMLAFPSQNGAGTQDSIDKAATEGKPCRHYFIDKK